MVSDVYHLSIRTGYGPNATRWGRSDASTKIRIYKKDSIISSNIEWYIEFFEDDYFLFWRYNRTVSVTGYECYKVDGWDGLEEILKQKI